MILEQFQVELNAIIGILKPTIKRGKMSAFTKANIKKLDFYPGYTENLSEYLENRVHSDGDYPESLFEKIAPNQTKDEKDYVKSTYQPTTKNTFQKFSNTVKRAFINGLIEWPPESDTETNASNLKEFKNYLSRGIPQYNSMEFFMSNLTDEKLKDANGICAVLPKFKVEEIEDGANVIAEVLPVPTIYHTNRVYYNDGESYIVESFEKTLVKVGDSMQMVGFVFILFTDREIIWARQYGKQEDYKFEFESWEHNVGFTPAVRLSGMPVLYGEKLSFSSPFSTAVPELNLAVLDSANILIIKRKVAYPTRVFIAKQCNYQINGATCNNGQIRITDGKSEPRNITCPNCRGTGKVGVFGPQSELMIDQVKNGEDNQIKAQDAMAYVSPPVDTPKLLREEIKQFTTNAEEILHLKAEPRGSGNISATEKNQDAKNTEAFIKPISDQLWYIYGYLIESMGRMVYTDEVYDAIKPNLIRPARFDLLQDEDYMLQIGEAISKGLPQVIINKLIYDYFRASNYEDTFSGDVFALIEQADPILNMTPNDIALGLSRGTIEKWESVLHTKSFYLIMQLYRESNGLFFEKEMSEQIKELQAAAVKAVPADASIALPKEGDFV